MSLQRLVRIRLTAPIDDRYVVDAVLKIRDFGFRISRVALLGDGTPLTVIKIENAFRGQISKV